MPVVLPVRWFVPARLLLVLCCLLPRLAAAQTPPAFDMATRVIAPIPGPGSRPFSHDVAVDAAGNSYVSGDFLGPVTFGTTTVPAGSSDVFVAKLDAAGNPRWIVTIKAGKNINNAVVNSRLAVDASGNVYVAGTFVSPTLTLGSTTLTNAGGADLFVGKLDPNGNWQSAVRAGGSGNEVVGSLALDGSGTAYLAGEFTGTTRFGSTALVSAGREDFFVARLDASGSWRWAVGGGGSGAEWNSDVGVDAHGFVYLASLVETGGQFGSFTIPATAALVAKIDAATGTCQRVTSVGGIRYFNNGHLAVAADGICWLAGNFRNTVRFGNFPLTSTGNSAFNEDLFVAKLDAAGAWQWASTVGGPSGEYSRGIAVDARGNAYLTGTFGGASTQFGSVTLVAQNAQLFFSDVFVAKLDPTGNWLWAVPAGGLQSDISTSLALGPFDTPYIVGEYFSPSMTFGALATPGAPNHLASTFVARLQPNQLRISGDSVLCNGGSTQLTASTFATGPISFRWNTGATTASIAVTQPGTYSATATFTGGYSLTEQFRVRSIAPSVQITGGSGFLCPGTPRQLTAVAPGAGAVRWSTGATTPSITVTQSGPYSVVATYGPACRTTAQVTVASNALRIGGRLQLCPGQSTTLTAIATGSAASAYQWNTGATTPTLLVGQAGTYRVTATLAGGCQLTATHTVGPPVATVASVSGDTLLCPGTVLTLSALNPDALTYQWTTGATTPTIAIAQPGRYGVLLTYTGGCTSRDSLLVAPAPVAPVFTLGPDTTLCLEQPLRLQAPAFEGPGVVRRWSDGSSGPSLLVREPGTYSLQFTTPCGTRTASRRVAYASCLRIPNVITPNNDQRNDRFVVEGLTQGDWDLTLYTRWGKQVYHAAAYRHDWGGDAAPGTYYYLLRNATTNVMHKGWLEVIR